MSSVETRDGSKERIMDSLHCSKTIAGLTHNFYRYPARMSPELAREVICQFSNVDDLILDPFMGGGTGIVEALAYGRRAIGIDINPLSAFVTAAKTTPLSVRDHVQLRCWVREVDFSIKAPALEVIVKHDPRTVNLPLATVHIFAQALEALNKLPFPRQQRFARCTLLRLGQWAVDNKRTLPTASELKEKLICFTEEMLAGLDQFVSQACSNGTEKRKLTGQRLLLLRSGDGIERDKRLQPMLGKPRLVITSPPYPGVHVLYHRWQVAGRRETPAPYWLIDAQDGHGPAHYTLGGRSAVGKRSYFDALTAIYRSIRATIHPDAIVVQLVSFVNQSEQLPAYLKAMEFAGYREDIPFAMDRADLWRTVPNRKWYNRIDTDRGTGRELLLFHRPISTQIIDTAPTSLMHDPDFE